MTKEKIECGRCFGVFWEGKFNTHKCNPSVERPVKRSEKDQLLHDIIVNKRYEKLDSFKEQELDEFIEMLVGQEPKIVEKKRKGVQKLYLDAYLEALGRKK